MIYGCLQPRELWFIDFNHVLGNEIIIQYYTDTRTHVHVHVHDKNLSVQTNIHYTSSRL